MNAGIVGIAVIDILLFLFLVLTAIALTRLRNLFAVVMLALPSSACCRLSSL